MVGSALLNRGRRLSSCTLDDAGNVNETPDALTAQATAILGRAVTVTAYTRARVSYSEHPAAGAKEIQCIQNVLANDAAKEGWDVVKCATVTNPAVTSAIDGEYGHQSGRRYASYLDPYEAHLAIAEQLEAGTLGDLTFGATHYVHITGYASFADFLDDHANVKKWIAAGVVPVDLGGVSTLRVFVPSAVAQAQGLQSEATG